MTPESISPETKLHEELDLSEMRDVLLLMALEEEFRIKIPDADAAAVRTVGEVIDCVRRHLKSGDAC